MSYSDVIPFEELKGKTLTEIAGLEAGAEEVYFTDSDGQRYKMYHSQDCCESVNVEDVIGDFADLLNSPLLLTEEVVSENEDPEGAPKSHQEYRDDSFTWTFYKLATIKGSVTIRWYGSSNGYYSESVQLEKV